MTKSPEHKHVDLVVMDCSEVDPALYPPACKDCGDSSAAEPSVAVAS